MTHCVQTVKFSNIQIQRKITWTCRLTEIWSNKSCWRRRRLGKVGFSGQTCWVFLIFEGLLKRNSSKRELLHWGKQRKNVNQELTEEHKCCCISSSNKWLIKYIILHKRTIFFLALDWMNVHIFLLKSFLLWWGI